MAKPATFKDHYRETRIFRSRALVATAVVLVAMLVLVIRLFYLQVYQHETYRTKADSNRISKHPIAPNRGLIFDRNGVLLADNQPTYSVSIIKELAGDIDQTIESIGKLITLKEGTTKRFKKRLSQRRRPYSEVPLRYRLNEEEIAKLSVNLHNMPGVSIEASLVRSYPHKSALAHTIGYVGRINERELKKVNANNYSATEHIGKTGVERFYENQLHGQVGYQTVETNARGKITRVLDREAPIPGDNLHLYLDWATQQAAINTIGDRRGAAIAIDPSTGGILAFSSMPAFDANLFVTGIDYKSYKELQGSRARPLFNRGIQGQYPPGSTIKPIIAIAGVEKGTTNWERKIYDPGWYKLENDDHLYRDWKKYGHGMVDLSKAIMRSCDTYFYELAHNLGIDNIHDFMAPFGFGTRTNIDMVSEKPGILPSRFWKKATKSQPWYPGETLIAGIGQGYMLATPLQLAVSTAILANRGKIIAPRMVQSIETDGYIADLPTPEKSKDIILKDPINWDKAIAGMEKVVHNPRGTAYKLSKGIQYKMAGKSGTAQVFTIKQDEKYDASKISEWHRDHALFIAFAPIENPKIAVAVIIENGGGGGTNAGPVARAMIDAYLLPQLANANTTP
ncbi:penicillin-binding protein 2 [Gammaproteobacteria bacterium 42_54_T18]|nr:penicillin-binding protein 2 [Gammaproteobacteria bacterium 42_54_T18]